MPKEKNEIIAQSFEGIFEDSLFEEIVSKGQIKEFATDEVIIRVGDKLTQVPLLLEGSIKISRENDQAEELLLYYLESGDTCSMTVQCCFGKAKSEIKATSMEQTTLLMIPVELVRSWFDKYPSWRNFVLESFQTRMKELLEAIDVITFMRLDERLMKYLRDQAKLHGSLEINLTHQQIASDLNSSRAVVSRVLKQLEVREEIKLYRNKIVLSTI